MENSFQTSFIPKKPISSVESTSEKPKSVFVVLSVILLILMVTTSIGFFIYKSYLTKQKEALSSSLLKVHNSFEKGTIDELELFDKRVSAAKNILDNHIVLSPTFKLLGDLTIPTIQYTKFEERTTKDKGLVVKLSGISKDYKSIAIQAGVFNSPKGRYFKNVIFSNLTKNRKNYVTFDIEFNIDPSLLSYEKNFSLKQAQVDSSQLPDNLNSN